MSYIQITMHKVVTVVTEVNKIATLISDAARSSLNNPQSVDYEEVFGSVDPVKLWAVAVDCANKVVSDETEFLGAGEANMVCHTCLEPIEVNAVAHIKMDVEGLSFTDPKDITVICSAEPSHRLPDHLVAAVRNLILKNEQ